MAILRAKDIKKMTTSEITDKLKDLKIELIKAKVGKKTGKVSQREIKRTIARLLTFKKTEKEVKTKK
jgi:ribosomal protein L29